MQINPVTGKPKRRPEAPGSRAEVVATLSHWRRMLRSHLADRFPNARRIELVRRAIAELEATRDSMPKDAAL